LGTLKIKHDNSAVYEGCVFCIYTEMTGLNSHMFFEMAYLIILLAAAGCLVALTHLLGQLTPIPMQIGVAWLLLWVGIDVVFVSHYSSPPLHQLITAMLHQLENRMFAVESALLGVTRLDKRVYMLQRDMQKLKRSNSE